MLKISLICIAAGLCCNAFSQKYDNNWIFGDSTGLSFSSEPPSYVNSAITGYEANASISDTDGNLLFYTNGQNVWNKEHQIMPNGDSLEIGRLFLVSDNDGFSSSITQGTIILPKPGSSEYYIFYIQAQSVPEDLYGLEYAVINVDLDGGLGDVTSKNIKIYDGKLSEKMQAVKHANGRDWWLLLRTMKEEDSDTQYFLRYLITPYGIGDATLLEIGSDDLYGTGEMIFSQDGALLAYTLNDYLYLYNFDRCTGELTESNFIQIEDHYLYGCSFSQNGSKIYLSEGCGKDLYQYEIFDGTIIDSTKKVIYHGPTSSYCQSQLELGPDRKLYFAFASDEAFSNDYNVRNQNLSVINFPDEAFPSCDFDTNTISLGDKRVLFGLPNMPNYSLGVLIGSGCDTLTEITDVESQQNNINIYPNPVSTSITVISNLNSYDKATVIIYNIQGVKVKTIDLSSGKQEVNITGLPDGIYTVNIRNNTGNIYNTKLVITK